VTFTDHHWSNLLTIDVIQNNITALISITKTYKKNCSTKFSKNVTKTLEKNLLTLLLVSRFLLTFF